MRRHDRSPEAQVWRRWYHTARWQRLRLRQLEQHPLCKRCEGRGRVTPATEVHHSVPHKGDFSTFWAGPFESLCGPCHSGPTQQAERIGYSTDIGEDGLPLDELHPANR